MTMAEFSLEDFIRNPSEEQLSSLTLKKDDLLGVADHYEIASVKRYMPKSQILTRVVEFLVEEGILPSEAAQNIVATPSFQSPVLESQAMSSVSDEVRIKELELERAKVELEREKLAVHRNERDVDRHFDC